MSGNIIRCELNIRYTITHPDWVCEWILPFDKTEPVKRSCLLKSNVDPLDPSKSDYIIQLMPGLFNDVQRAQRGVDFDLDHVATVGKARRVDGFVAERREGPAQVFGQIGQTLRGDGDFGQGA